jgi:diaminopimelate decarboxylase
VTHTLIYPHTSRHDSAGHLEIGGCDVVELAEAFGTPLFVYDEQTLRDQCRAYVAAFAGHAGESRIVYASKAFSCRAMIELVAQEGLALDVASGGELAAACAAAFPPADIFFHGNNKTAAELELALDYGIGYVVVDSFSEIAALDAAAGRRGVVQQVLVRITPGVTPATHAAVQTGQPDSKFGFGLTEGQATEALALCLAARHLEPVGVHAHIGSQIFDLSSYRRAVEILMGSLAEWRAGLSFDCRLFNLGGGLGIRYTARDQPSSITELATVAGDAVAGEAARHGLTPPTILVEPGRSIAGKAAVTLYRVGTIKQVAGGTTYVAVDGGMSDNIRPMLYGSRYEAMIGNRADVPATFEATVVGKHCESGDVLVRDVRIAPPELGDVLVTPGTGAYGYAMANNYNGQPRPAVVMVAGGKVRVIIARETWDDVLRLQRPLADAAVALD